MGTVKCSPGQGALVPEASASAAAAVAADAAAGAQPVVPPIQHFLLTQLYLRYNILFFCLAGCTSDTTIFLFLLNHLYL